MEKIKFDFTTLGWVKLTVSFTSSLLIFAGIVIVFTHLYLSDFTDHRKHKSSKDETEMESRADSMIPFKTNDYQPVSESLNHSSPPSKSHQPVSRPLPPLQPGYLSDEEKFRLFDEARNRLLERDAARQR